MCSLSMVCLLKKSRNLFSFGCNTSLRAICRSLPLLVSLPAAPKESVHLRKLLKGIRSALSGVAWSLSPVSVRIAAPNQALREGHSARMWRVPLSKDHCMWCPARRHFLLVPGTHAKTLERSVQVTHPVHAWHVSQGRREATEAAREHSGGSSQVYCLHFHQRVGHYHI